MTETHSIKRKSIHDINVKICVGFFFNKIKHAITGNEGDHQSLPG